MKEREARRRRDWIETEPRLRERERDDGLPDGDFLLPSSPWTSNERQKQNESEEGSK